MDRANFLFILSIALSVLSVDAQSSTPIPLSGVRFIGAEPNSHSGTSVASCDINHDGFKDMIIGSPYVPRDNVSDTGRADVIWGPMPQQPFVDLALNQGASGFQIWGIPGPRELSWTMACRDVNGDGYDDIALGGYLAENEIGAVYVIYGRNTTLHPFPSLLNVTTLNGTDGFAIIGLDTLQWFGFGLTLCDVNGDSMADIIAATPYSSPQGDVSVVYGRNTSFNATNPLESVHAYHIVGATNDLLGIVLSCGDINNDGFEDIVASAYGYTDLDPGKAYIIYGNRSSSIASNLSIGQGSTPNSPQFTLFTASRAGDQFGFSVGVGDVNGDHIDDVLVGVPDSTIFPFAGDVYVFYGSTSRLPSTIFTTQLTGSNGFRITGPNRALIGLSVGSAGDFNQDGFEDIVIGAPFAYGALDTYQSGQTFIIFGRQTFPAVVALSSLGGWGFVLNGDEVDSLSGVTVAAAGDMNQDGFSDVFITATESNVLGRSLAGETWLLYGANYTITNTTNYNFALTPYLRGVGCSSSCAACVNSPTNCSVCANGTWTNSTTFPLICTSCDVCTTGRFSSTLCGPFQNAVCSNCSTDCPFNTYLSLPCNTSQDITCLACDPSCNSCTGPNNTDCFRCNSEYFDSDPSPTFTRCTACQPECTSHHYEQVPCTSQSDRVCGVCHESCLECTGPNANGCMGCATDYWNSNPDNTTVFTTCIPCSTECPFGQYIAADCDVNSDIVCSGCNNQCSGCTGPSQFDCLGCKGGLYASFTPTGGIVCQTCSVCTMRQYKASECDATHNTNCTDCAQSCSTCNQLGCLTCFPGFQLYQDQCIVCPSNCDFCNTTDCVTCSPGYEYDGEFCKNADACSVSPCILNAKCTDLSPPSPKNSSGRLCSCNTGFAGDGETECIVQASSSTWSTTLTAGVTVGAFLTGLVLMVGICVCVAKRRKRRQEALQKHHQALVNFEQQLTRIDRISTDPSAVAFHPNTPPSGGPDPRVRSSSTMPTEGGEEGGEGEGDIDIEQQGQHQTRDKAKPKKGKKGRGGGAGDDLPGMADGADDLDAHEFGDRG